MKDCCAPKRYWYLSNEAVLAYVHQNSANAHVQQSNIKQVCSEKAWKKRNCSQWCSGEREGKKEKQRQLESCQPNPDLNLKLPLAFLWCTCPQTDRRIASRVSRGSHYPTSPRIRVTLA